MMAWLAGALREHPELALFLVIALGHAIARLRLGPVRLNVVIGVLIAGVAVGQDVAAVTVRRGLGRTAAIRRQL